MGSAVSSQSGQPVSQPLLKTLSTPSLRLRGITPTKKSGGVKQNLKEDKEEDSGENGSREKDQLQQQPLQRKLDQPRDDIPETSESPRESRIDTSNNNNNNNNDDEDKGDEKEQVEGKEEQGATIAVQAFDASEPEPEDQDTAETVISDAKGKKRMIQDLDEAALNQALMKEEDDEEDDEKGKLLPPMITIPQPEPIVTHQQPASSTEKKSLSALSTSTKPQQQLSRGFLSPSEPPVSPSSPHGFFSPGSPGIFEGPRIKGEALCPVGGTRLGDSGYYASSKSASKWQFWTFDFINGWSLVADCLSPKKCIQAVDNLGVQDTAVEQDVLGREKERGSLFQLIPLFGEGDEQVDSVVEEKLNATGFDLEERDDEGNSYLIRATEFRKAPLVTMLLKKGISTSTKNDYGFAALHYACYSSSASYAITKSLLEFGAFPDIPDSSGCTALHYAAAEGRSQLVALLLYHKARVDLFDCNGFTALSYAQEHGCKKCISLLQGAAASIYEWKECLDTSTNYKYYYNLVTGKTQWEPPPGFKEKQAKANTATSANDWDKDKLQREILKAMQEPASEEAHSGKSGRRVPEGPVDVVQLAEALFDPILGDHDNQAMVSNNSLDQLSAFPSVMFDGDDDMTKLMNDLIKENETLKKKVEKERRHRKRQQQNETGNSRRRRKEKDSGVHVSCILHPNLVDTGEGQGLRIDVSGNTLAFRRSSKGKKDVFREYKQIEDLVLKGSNGAGSFTSVNLVLDKAFEKTSNAVLLFGNDASQALFSQVAEQVFCLVDKNGYDGAIVKQIEIGQAGCFDVLSSSEKVTVNWQDSHAFDWNAKRVGSSKELLHVIQKGYEQRDVFSPHVTTSQTLSNVVTVLELQRPQGDPHVIFLVDLAVSEVHENDAHVSEKERKHADYLEASLSTLTAFLKQVYRKKDTSQVSEEVKSDALCAVLAPTILLACPLALVFILDKPEVRSRQLRDMERLLHAVKT